MFFLKKTYSYSLFQNKVVSSETDFFLCHPFTSDGPISSDEIWSLKNDLIDCLVSLEEEQDKN